MSGWRELLEAAALRTTLLLLRRLGPRRASDLGGRLARLIGPWLPVSRVADANLARALPGLDAGARVQVIRGVWDNLGRTVAELPHLASFERTTKGPGFEIAGEHHFAALRDSGRPAIFISGHFGNWELVLPLAAWLGMPVSGIYRAASNRRVDAAIQSLRQTALGPRAAMFPKGREGAIAALRHLSAGGSLGLLADQKMNDGIPVPFFGRDAMTTPGPAQFALRFGLPILPVHTIRLGPARIRIIIDPPIMLSPTGDTRADVRAAMGKINAIIERWVRENPASWLWLHRRWPKAG